MLNFFQGIVYRFDVTILLPLKIHIPINSLFWKLLTMFILHKHTLIIFKMVSIINIHCIYTYSYVNILQVHRYRRYHTCHLDYSSWRDFRLLIKQLCWIWKVKIQFWVCACLVYSILRNFVSVDWNKTSNPCQYTLT